MNGATPTRWWWLRHAPVVGGEGLVYGRTDLPIEPPSPTAVQELAAALPCDAVWITSHLRRTRDTARHFADYHPGAADAIEEPAFAEMDFGGWENRRRDDIPAAEQQAFWADFVHSGPPGGESFGAVVDRVVAAVTRHTDAHAGRDIVVVGHSGSIKAALTLGAGVTPESTLAFATDPLRLTCLECSHDNGAAHWSITMVNGRAR